MVRAGSSGAEASLKVDPVLCRRRRRHLTTSTSADCRHQCETHTDESKCSALRSTVLHPFAPVRVLSIVWPL